MLVEGEEDLERHLAEESATYRDGAGAIGGAVQYEMVGSGRQPSRRYGDSGERQRVS